MVEALRGVGSLLGPLLGGFLYDTGGFALPFQVAGGTAALIGVGGFALLPRSSAGEAPGRSASIARLLRIPAVFAGSAVMVSVAMIAISFLDPTLQPHLAQPPYRLQPTSVGALFTLSMVGYILASLASGPLARRVGDVKQLCAGVWCLALAYLLLGPSPLLPALRPSFPLAAAAMLLIGAGAAIAYTPTNNLSLRACEVLPAPKRTTRTSTLPLGRPAPSKPPPRLSQARGIAVNEASAALTAIVNMSFTVGCLIGPSLGGSLVQAAGFGGASTALGAHPAHPPACAPPPAPTPSALATQASCSPLCRLRFCRASCSERGGLPPPMAWRRCTRTLLSPSGRSRLRRRFRRRLCRSRRTGRAEAGGRRYWQMRWEAQCKGGAVGTVRLTHARETERCACRKPDRRACLVFAYIDRTGSSTL